MDIILSKTKNVVLMQCNTNYTGSDDNFKYCNLNVLKKFSLDYPKIMLGLSDHTSGHATTLGAISLGARVIEKHFTDDNSHLGPDHSFAMNPNTWREMVDSSNELFLSLGDGKKVIEANEEQTAIVQRRALRYSKNLKLGTKISKKDIVSK